MDGILGTYSYLYSIINIALMAIRFPNAPVAKRVHTIEISLIGSRLSAKTIQILRFLIEFGIISKQEGIEIATTIIRYEPKGAEETFDELMGVATDIYGIKLNRYNTNLTKRQFKAGNNNIRAIGIMSNRKSKTPKLGLARKGVKKSIQINVWDEITEIPDAKMVEKVHQSIGGADFNINIKIANPWVLSMWYVKGFNKQLQFNEKILREKGEQFKSTYIKSKKTLRYFHITNHRVNSFLSEAQHQSLYNTWDVDETLARVADLGMPGVAEGLVYAPIIDRITEPARTMRVMKHKAGLDWGTSTGVNGSATALIIGRIAKDYNFVSIDKEYYHSNAKQTYKNDDQLIEDVIYVCIEYIKANYESIKNSEEETMTLYYDYGADLLGKALKTEIEAQMSTAHKYLQLLIIKPCVKYDVPVRINGNKSIMGQGRYKVNREQCPNHIEELESARWDDTRVVHGQPTRVNADDHTLDASEYMIGADLPRLLSDTYLKYNKLMKSLM